MSNRRVGGAAVGVVRAAESGALSDGGGVPAGAVRASGTSPCGAAVAPGTAEPSKSVFAGVEPAVPSVGVDCGGTLPFGAELVCRPAEFESADLGSAALGLTAPSVDCCPDTAETCCGAVGLVRAVPSLAPAASRPVDGAPDPGPVESMGGRCGAERSGTAVSLAPETEVCPGRPLAVGDPVSDGIGRCAGESGSGGRCSACRESSAGEGCCPDGAPTGVGSAAPGGVEVGEAVGGGSGSGGRGGSGGRVAALGAGAWFGAVGRAGAGVGMGGRDDCWLEVGAAPGAGAVPLGSAPSGVPGGGGVGSAAGVRAGVGAGPGVVSRVGTSGAMGAGGRVKSRLGAGAGLVGVPSGGAELAGESVERAGLVGNAEFVGEVGVRGVSRFAAGGSVDCGSEGCCGGGGSVPSGAVSPGTGLGGCAFVGTEGTGGWAGTGGRAGVDGWAGTGGWAGADDWAGAGGSDGRPFAAPSCGAGSSKGGSRRGASSAGSCRDEGVRPGSGCRGTWLSWRCGIRASSGSGWRAASAGCGCAGVWCSPRVPGSPCWRWESKPWAEPGSGSPGWWPEAWGVRRGSPVGGSDSGACASWGDGSWFQAGVGGMRTGSRWGMGSGSGVSLSLRPLRRPNRPPRADFFSGMSSSCGRFSTGAS